jgi:hypothetical protein
MKNLLRSRGNIRGKNLRLRSFARCGGLRMTIHHPLETGTDWEPAYQRMETQGEVGLVLWGAGDMIWVFLQRGAPQRRAPGESPRTRRVCVCN